MVHHWIGGMVPGFTFCIWQSCYLASFNPKTRDWCTVEDRHWTNSEVNV